MAFKVVWVDLINELLHNSWGGGLVLRGLFKPFKELEIKNTLVFLKILNYSLQFKKNKTIFFCSFL